MIDGLVDDVWKV